MGLFDTINCDYPLPLPLEVIDLIPDIYNVEFQTKDLDNCMYYYKITEEGELLHFQQESKWVDDDDAFFKGYLKVISEKIININYHGNIVFGLYKEIKDANDPLKGISVLIDFKVKFTDGEVEEISVERYSIEDCSQRLLQMDNFMKRSEIEKNLWYNKYLFNTSIFIFIKREIILTPIRKLERGLSKLHMFLMRNI